MLEYFSDSAEIHEASLQAWNSLLEVTPFFSSIYTDGTIGNENPQNPKESYGR